MPVASPWPSLAPYPQQPAWYFLSHAARRFPTKPALIDENGSVCSYGELWDASSRIARFLQHDANVTRGQTVAIIAPGNRESIAFLYGALIAGACVTFLNAFLRPNELAYYLTDSETEVVFTSNLAMRTLEAACAATELPHLRRVYEGRSLWEQAAKEPPTPEPVSLDPSEDLAFLVYSGGTTGWPSAAMRTHAGCVAAWRQRLAVEPPQEDGIVLSLRPLWTDSPFVIAAGATAVTFAGFDPEKVLALMHRHRVTDLLVRPTAAQALLKHAIRQAPDLPSLRLIESAGAPLALPVIEQLKACFAVPVIQAYQMTQVPAANRAPRHAHRANTVGPPLPDTEEQIVDPETGLELRRGETGELWIRGPQVMRGYWHNPGATSAELLPGGWMRSGDLARFDSDGYLYIVDRLKALIKVGDWPVFPAEIEAVLLEHPAVADAAVVSRASEARGEVPVAFVVRRESHPVESDTLLAMVASRLAPYKVPKALQFVAELPRSRDGKLLRRVLVEQVRSQEPTAPDRGETGMAED
jgi:acyl-CoA synthetase (AMP-forming)/AMP-acid ligase II